ncbi:hypothetical protein A3C09_01860 [Candidatus Uhrbacteria bacterium RIFCSPHIGHO2_02_FULL_47_44]|uniref:Uncharacterized protein n=1 Tax=Candidatus Uhrbacteria bacterium RIFCSPLOWO2_02_FULL_48_18 TaxID=1802408 RepID=A0A1F7V9F2_9BACT|nr:MAG: hypothetical protein A2839_03620 [Candidatus Uhrbacteria bacterium RIFCSPHIGHO2_01_FULL_47_10]OGL71719.1 MAG: hypothetical protein A3C09_01860 [Candidatus Uhrbacteria bacterium RIFCSPHIGHO2_02_FULL_47_44]OGL76197.1 MAG: hypothetical protein A3E97_03140 [Candidatus Uhrbacteria bacterium RIFCSPHIGHO2_12_FULL_47_12]OGL81882.1 MAG: hypothetical protein A3B20_02215 [Candidatus Uhrbacteria bacterium RIFCSPLOWO2_01_FULL_47_17]OGL87045.1 MAG: hypothetical protein A3I41_03805 [Candidatus Uhrbact
MVSLLEIIFATVTLVWAGLLVYRQNWLVAYKAAAYLLGAFLLFAMWNRPLAGQWGMTSYGPFIVILATIGVAIVGNWAYRRWSADNRVTIAIAIMSLGLVLVFWYPFFVAGPSSITPSIPTAPTPVASAPTPAPSAPPSSAPVSRPRRAPQVFDLSDCPNLSYEWQKDLGCPQAN